MWGYGGRMIYPFVLFTHAKKDVPDWLFRHEMEHVYQVMRMGWWAFHAKYLWYLMRVGYISNPLELQATVRQSEPLTQTEKRFKD